MDDDVNAGGRRDDLAFNHGVALDPIQTRERAGEPGRVRIAVHRPHPPARRDQSLGDSAAHPAGHTNHQRRFPRNHFTAHRGLHALSSR